MREQINPLSQDSRAVKLLQLCGVTPDLWNFYGLTFDQAIGKSVYIRGVGTVTREYPKTLPEITICKFVITPPKGMTRSVHLIDNGLTGERVCLEQRLKSHLLRLLLMLHDSRKRNASTTVSDHQSYFTLAVMEKLLLQGYPKVRPGDLGNKVFNFKKQAIMSSFRKLVGRIQEA